MKRNMIIMAMSAIASLPSCANHVDMHEDIVKCGGFSHALQFKMQGYTFDQSKQYEAGFDATMLPNIQKNSPELMTTGFSLPGLIVAADRAKQAMDVPKVAALERKGAIEFTKLSETNDLGSIGNYLGDCAHSYYLLSK